MRCLGRQTASGRAGTTLQRGREVAPATPFLDASTTRKLSEYHSPTSYWPQRFADVVPSDGSLRRLIETVSLNQADAKQPTRPIEDPHVATLSDSCAAC